MPMFKRGCVVLLVIVASACGSSNSTPTDPTPSPVASLDPSITLNVLSPTGFDTLLLGTVSVTGVWGAQTPLTPTNPATTTVSYTTRLSVGTYGVEFDPLHLDSSGSSISFSGALAGNTGGVQPNSIVVVYVQHDASHVTVNRCSVIVPSDVGEVDLTFVVIRADFTQVC